MHLRGTSFDGLTFGMEVSGSSKPYKAMKNQIKREKIKGLHGIEVDVFTVPSEHLGAVMGEAHWLVTEKQSFKFVQFDNGEKIYVKYNGEVRL